MGATSARRAPGGGVGPCSGHWATGAGADRTRGRQRSAGPPSHVADSSRPAARSLIGVPDAQALLSTRTPTSQQQRLIAHRRPEPCCCCCCSSSSAPASQVNPAHTCSPLGACRSAMQSRPRRAWAKGAKHSLVSFNLYVSLNEQVVSGSARQ